MGDTDDDQDEFTAGFVRWLLDLAAGGAPAPADVALAERAGDWLSSTGWTRLTPFSYTSAERGILLRQWGAGFEVLHRGAEGYPTVGHTYPVDDLAHALNTLCGLQILPGVRFSTYARDALLDQATVYLRTAELMDVQACRGGRYFAQPPTDGAQFAVAHWVFREAARSAQRMAQQQLTEPAASDA